MIHERAEETGLMPGHVPVPLPTEIPPPPNLSQLPAHILHSGTVETLIGQNEDLMARLKVNIRRNSILEQQLMEQDRINQQITHAHNSLLAQMQVLREKDAIWREKSQTIDSKTHAFHEELDIMRERVEAAEERKSELQAGIKFEQAYRRRIRAWVRPYINDLRHQLDEAKIRAGFLDRQLAGREAVIGDLRERMTNAVAQMQHVQRTANQDQALLVEKYEARAKASEAEAQSARTELQLYRDKANRLDSAISAQTTAENRIVYLERKNQEMESALSGEMKEIQEQMNSFRKEAKQLAAEVVTSKQERDRMKIQRDQAVEEQARLQDQFESLQAVWAEAQKKFEASRLQQDSLNRLNQELSRQLQADRKARGETSLIPVTDAQPKSSGKSLDRIDSLLAALEAGFIKGRGGDTQMASLDLIETDHANETAIENKSGPRDLGL